VTETVTCFAEVIQNGQWIAPLAVLLSAAVGASVAFWAIKSNREIARKRATLDVILKSESDEYFERIYTVFSSEKKRSQGLEALLLAETDGETRAKLEVDNFLNHYELVAISIDQGILDESFYKKWMRSTYISHYKESVNYIKGIRKKNPRAFIAFQGLVEKWVEEDAK